MRSGATKLWQVLAVGVTSAQASLATGIESTSGHTASHLVLSRRNCFEFSVVCIRHELVLRIGGFREELLLSCARVRTWFLCQSRVLVAHVGVDIVALGRSNATNVLM